MKKKKILTEKIFFTIFILFIIRVISQIPIPYIKDKELVKSLFEGVGTLGLLNVFTGNALSQLSIAALSITPYISASIIMQVLMTSSKRLEELNSQGEYGQEVIRRYKKYLSFVLSFISAIFLTRTLSINNVIESGAVPTIVVTAILMTTANIIYFLADRISYKGVFEGVSMVLLMNIITSIPKDLGALYTVFFVGESVGRQIINGIVIVAVILFIMIFTIVLNNSYRKIPVESFRNISNNHIRNGYLPLKANVSGIMPIIYAMSILGLPASLNMIFRKESGVLFFLTQMNDPSNWFNSENLVYSLGFVLFLGLIVFFSYFYSESAFNPKEISNYLNTNSMNIVGIKHGEPTVRYLDDALRANVRIGLMGLLIITSIPLIINTVFKVGLSLAGTSFIVIISIASEVRKEIKAFLI